MPPEIRPIIAIRGTDAYRRALVDLAAAVGASSINDLAERGLRMIAAAHGVTLPERTTNTRGGPRPGAGRPSREKNTDQ